MRRCGNNFRSPTFLGTSFPSKVVVPFPVEYDPNTFYWYSADKYVTTYSGQTTMQVWGNRSTRQVSKTDTASTGCTNLTDVGGYAPYVSEAGSDGNFALYSSRCDTGYAEVSGATRSGTTLVTFTSQNGYVRKPVDYRLCEAASCTFSVKIRRISGNTALHIITGTTDTPITITDTEATYSVVFAGPPLSPSLNLYIGIKDKNAAGFGQIEVKEWHLRLTSWGSTYLLTDGTPRLAGVNGTKYMSFARKDAMHQNVGSNTVPLPGTIYMSFKPGWMSLGKPLCINGGTFGTYNWYFGTGASAGQWQMYTSSGNKSVASSAAWLTDFAWCILTLTIQSSGVSTMRRNLETAYSGTLGAIGAGKISWMGAHSYFGDMDDWFLTTDFFWRVGVDSASTQEAYVRYLAQKIGISV